MGPQLPLFCLSLNSVKQSTHFAFDRQEAVDILVMEEGYQFKEKSNEMNVFF